MDKEPDNILIALFVTILEIMLMVAFLIMLIVEGTTIGTGIALVLYIIVGKINDKIPIKPEQG